MKLFSKFKKEKQEPGIFWNARENENPFSVFNSYKPLSSPEIKLYETIKEGVPIVDSAINKTVRLTGGFKVTCENEAVQNMLDEFVQTVNVSGVGMGLDSFVSAYFESLLTYGNAIGEIIVGENKEFLGLYNAPVENIEVRQTSPLSVDFYVNQNGVDYKKVENKELILFSALNPKPGEVVGISVLRSLPFVSMILLKIYNCIGQNFDRVGNIRYAVTYKPGNDSVEKAYAKDRASMIAKEWSEGMRGSENGQVRDFITVGDVNIKVIGADNQLIDTDIPVRQMLEQIIAKLSIPPFLLGLSWSTTERMSQQQTDILTTELMHYRRILSPVILKICTAYLRLKNVYSTPTITWNTINLKDEVEAAQTRLYNAQAHEIEVKLEGGD